MKRNSMTFMCAGIVTLALSSSANAWGPVGHAAVGGIADRLLVAAAREQVAALLVGDLDHNGNPSGRTRLEEVASWPDEIRGSAADRPNRHFDDLPACGTLPATPTWCPADGECATHQIDALKVTLADKSAPMRDRNEALKWIVHLVGDLHQPLHSVSNFYRNGQQDKEHNTDDRGGNDLHVKLPGSGITEKLHHVWDSDLVSLTFGHAATDTTLLSSATLDGLAAQASQLPPSKTVGTTIAWAKESNHLARTTAYKSSGFVCGIPVDATTTLSKGYVTKAERVVHAQIELAGMRLATLLNEVFGGP